MGFNSNVRDGVGNTTISFKCVGTDATKPFNFNQCRSPRPLFNVVCHCSPSLMSIGIRIEKTTLGNLSM